MTSNYFDAKNLFQLNEFHALKSFCKKCHVHQLKQIKKLNSMRWVKLFRNLIEKKSHKTKQEKIYKLRMKKCLEI